MFSFPADNIHPEENPCFCSIIENYDVNTKLMFFRHFIPFSDIIIMVYNCFWEVIKSHEWNNKIIFCVRMSSWDFLGFWIHLQMPRSPENHVAFFYVFNYVCTSKNLAIAFWEEGGERDIWQKAFTFVLSFSKEIFPLASPCFTVKQENLCTTTMQFLNAICSMGFLSSSDNLKLSLFPKMQQQNQGISNQHAIPLHSSILDRIFQCILDIIRANCSNFFPSRGRPQSVAEQTSVSSFLVPQWHKKDHSPDCRYKW